MLRQMRAHAPRTKRGIIVDEDVQQEPVHTEQRMLKAEYTGEPHSAPETAANDPTADDLELARLERRQLLLLHRLRGLATPFDESVPIRNERQRAHNEMKHPEQDMDQANRNKKIQELTRKIANAKIIYEAHKSKAEEGSKRDAGQAVRQEHRIASLKWQLLHLRHPVLAEKLEISKLTKSIPLAEKRYNDLLQQSSIDSEMKPKAEAAYQQWQTLKDELSQRQSIAEVSSEATPKVTKTKEPTFYSPLEKLRVRATQAAEAVTRTTQEATKAEARAQSATEHREALAGVARKIRQKATRLEQDAQTLARALERAEKREVHNARRRETWESDRTKLRKKRGLANPGMLPESNPTANIIAELDSLNIRRQQILAKKNETKEQYVAEPQETDTADRNEAIASLQNAIRAVASTRQAQMSAQAEPALRDSEEAEINRHHGPAAMKVHKAPLSLAPTPTAKPATARRFRTVDRSGLAEAMGVIPAGSDNSRAATHGHASAVRSTQRDLTQEILAILRGESIETQIGSDFHASTRPRSNSTSRGRATLTEEQKGWLDRLDEARTAYNPRREF